ncbi:MAG: type VI secretion system lipoprotein TssJ [Polyangiaceae bacterium]
MTRRGGVSAGVPSLLPSLLGLALVGLGLSACSNPPPPEEPDPCNVQLVTLRLYGSDIINPNEDERPRPVSVRLYQVANDLRMQNARYDDILLRDADTLGEDLLKKDEVTVFPNDVVELKFERIPEAYYLAGAAMFRTPNGTSWKTFYKFPPMPNAPEACLPTAGDGDPEAPQAFPETAFFVVERKIDNGSQFDETMFPNSRPIRSINLPKGSATAE